MVSRDYGIGRERRLQRHLEREIDFYSMWQMRPDFERMDTEIKRLRALNRRIQRLVKGVTGKTP